jgi:hypothetical protein
MEEWSEVCDLMRSRLRGKDILRDSKLDSERELELLIFIITVSFPLDLQQGEGLRRVDPPKRGSHLTQEEIEVRELDPFFCSICDAAEGAWQACRNKVIATISFEPATTGTEKSRLIYKQVRELMCTHHGHPEYKDYLDHMELCETNMGWYYPLFAQAIWEQAKSTTGKNTKKHIQMAMKQGPRKDRVLESLVGSDVYRKYIAPNMSKSKSSHKRYPRITAAT